jgi:hypothetical protein
MEKWTLRELDYKLSDLKVAEWKRLSGRTYEQFKEDIKNATEDEKIIINKYADYCRSKFGVELTIIDNGCDNTGEFLEITSVTKDVDFIVNGVPVEVKTIRNKLDSFRLKVYSIQDYIKQKATMLLVSGWKTDNPEFTMITHRMMKQFLRTKKIELARDWENKRIIRFSYDDFKWEIL